MARAGGKGGLRIVPHHSIDEPVSARRWRSFLGNDFWGAETEPIEGRPTPQEQTRDAHHARCLPPSARPVGGFRHTPGNGSLAGVGGGSQRTRSCNKLI